MTRVERFGGAHTERKLDAVAGYLRACVAVMKKQRFKLADVDGFAGSGAPQLAVIHGFAGGHSSVITSV